MQQTLKTRSNQITRFLDHDIWKLDLADKTRFQRFFYQAIKVLILALRGVREDNVQLRASALTFFTLLSIVPVLAMAFGLAKGFGLDRELERQLLENFGTHQEVLNQTLAISRKLLSQTKGGIIAGAGLVFLFYTVMKLINNIEASFNDIWYIKKPRNLTRKLTDYLTIMIAGPILLVLANSLTVFIKVQIEQLTETVHFIGLFKGLIFPLLRLLPYIVFWLLFTLLYMIIPNTTVKPKSAIIGGIVAGTAFQITQWALIRFQINLSEYGAIYGSFSALPLFLGWLQLSWLIVLYGSEISYAVQNVDAFESNIRGTGYSWKYHKKVALALCWVVIRNFKENKSAKSISEINKKVQVPGKLIREVASELVECNILTQTRSKNDSTGYQPAVDTDLLTVQYILSAYEQSGANEIAEDDSEVMHMFSETVGEMDTLISESKINKLLKEI